MAFIDTLNNPILREMQKDYNRAIAQKIRNRLQQLENANDKDKRRWVWELLQNANDTVKNRQVNVEINVTNTYLEFRHDGGYFSPRNITNLVHQISSKEGDESIGRFGTGFLTTHTLSRTIKVSGVFFEDDNYSKFEITLYRTEDTEQGLVKCIEKTWNEFKEDKLPSKPKERVWTSFKYLNHNRKIADDTINDFITFIHYNLAFVQSIGSITVNNNLTNHNFYIKRKAIQQINNILSIIPFEGKINNQPFNKQLLFADNKEIQGAIEISNKEGKITVEQIASNIPRLFCAFPLVGTEKFLFPIVLNSRNFLPKTERDGLYLKGETTQTKRNKPLLESALFLYQSILKYLISKQADNLYLLAQHENPFKDDYFDVEWYKTVIQKPIQNTILNSPIVKTETGNFALLKVMRFPYYAVNNQLNLRITKQIWAYQSVLYPSLIPQKSDIEHWANLLWESCTKIDLEDIALYIQHRENIQNLKKQFVNKELDVFVWLNELIDFYVKNARLLLDKYKVIPNQRSIFCFKKDLYFDNSIPDILKDIYNIFGENWYNRLLSLNINALDNLFRAERKVRYINSIIQGINAKIEHKDTNKVQVQKAVFSLSRLIPTEKSNTEQIEYKNYRKELHKFSKDLFKNKIPTIIELENLPNQTWKSSDEWLLKHIVETIENCKNVNTLNNLLYGTNDKDVVLWLNDFYIFCIKRDKTAYLSKKIYPNQLGELNSKYSLYKDEKIAEELKDILEDLDKVFSTKDKNGWRHLLLDNKITVFDETLKLQSKTTKDVSDEINKKIPDLKTHPSKALKLIIFRLVALMKSENKHQRKLWEYLRAFYLAEVPKQLQVIENAEDFDWQPCFNWSMERLIKDITVLKYVDELEDELHGNLKVLDWLADFIEFVHETEDYKRLLDGEKYAVIPNQNGSFQIKSRLWLDDEINENLKKIIRLLNPAWLDDLVENKTIFVELPKDRERKTTDAALEVDRIFRTYKNDPQKAEYVQSFRIVSKWMNEQNNEFLRQNMNWISMRKAEIALSLLGSEKEKDEVFLIIESGKAPLLSKIANNKDITEEDLEKIIDNPLKFKNLIEAINNPPNPTLQQFTNDKIKEKTGGIIDSVDELIEAFNKLKREKEQQILKEKRTKPKFIVRTETKGGTTDWEAVKRSNELARKRIREHLGTIKENNQAVYDISGWTRASNTIIKNIKKNGIHIGLVTKGADKGVIYFNSDEREFLADTKKFTELWIHSQRDIFQITLGEILKIWNVQGITTTMFDI